MFLALEYGVEENKPLAVSRLISKGNYTDRRLYQYNEDMGVFRNLSRRGSMFFLAIIQSQDNNFTRKEKEAREAVN